MKTKSVYKLFNSYGRELLSNKKRSILREATMPAGEVIDVGFGGNKRGVRGPSKDLVERLSKQPDRTKVKSKPARAAAFEDAKPSQTSGGRAAVRINPVTGKMTTVAKTKDANDMVREGSMYIPKEYLHAAAAAGLGNANGMYSHMAGIRRELNSGHNLAGPSGTNGAGAARQPKYEPKLARVSGNIHKIDTSSSNSSSAPRQSNIKQITQGRARSLRSSSSQQQPNESSYLRQKGVINSFNGTCSNLRSSKSSNQDSNNSQRKKGVAQLKFGSSGQSYITYHEGPIKHAHRVTPPRTQSKFYLIRVVQ